MREDIFKLKKSIAKICLSAALLLSAVTISAIITSPVEAYAAETITISDTITGTLSDDGKTLTIIGTGEIPKLSTLVTGYSSVETVIIEEGITSVGEAAFREFTSLVHITLPSNLTTIGKNGFSGCTSLIEIVLPSKLTTIDKFAFSGCTSLAEITIPKSVTSASQVFGTGLQTITFEDGMTTIPSNICLDASELTTVNIPETVTTIGKQAFKGCTSLTEITLPSNLTTINNYAFSGCTTLTEITIPKSVTSASQVFGAGLQTITFEDGMTAIPNGICVDATNLTTVNIPKTVTSIGNQAFQGCTSLTEITLSDNITSIGSSAFKVSTETPTIVNTNNTYVKGLDWSSLYSRNVTFMDIEVDEEEPGNTDDENNSENTGNTQGLTMTGAVSPITTIDISIPLDALSFTIDGERNLTAETTQITNNSQYPLDMYILSVEPINDAPSIIAKDTYTEKEWNNLSAADTLKYISISVNDNELYSVFNNTERNHDLSILIGRLKSGFAEAQSLDLTPSAQYGKSFLNTESIILQYKVVFEVVIP